MRKMVYGLVSVVALTASAMGGVISDSPFFEAEANNTPATANFVGSFVGLGGAVLIDGVMTPGDVDWYYFTTPGPSHLVAAAYALPFSDFTTDGQLEVLDSTGTVILAFDDDDNIGFMPSLEVDIPAGGFYVGISGYDDGSGGTSIFDGHNSNGTIHTEDWAYKLIIGVNTPEPASLVLLGLGALALRRRR